MENDNEKEIEKIKKIWNDCFKKLVDNFKIYENEIQEFFNSLLGNPQNVYLFDIEEYFFYGNYLKKN